MYRSSCWCKIKKRLEELEKTIKNSSENDDSVLERLTELQNELEANQNNDNAQSTAISNLQAGLNANSEADDELRETVVNHISTDTQTEPMSSDQIQSLFS